eukprot:403362912
MNKKKLFLQNICKYTKKVKQNQSEQISKKLLNTESQRNGMMVKKNTLKYHSRKHQQQNSEKQGGSLQGNSAQFGLQNSRQYASDNNVGINNQLGKRNRVSNTFKYESEEEKTAGCLFRIHNYPKDKQGFQIPQKRIKSHQKQDQQSYQQDFSQGSNQENFNCSNIENQFQISPSQIRNNHNSDLLSYDFENLSLYKLRNQPRKPQSQQKFKFTKEIFAEFMLQRSMEKLKLIKDCDQDYYIRKLEADASHITNEVVKTLILNQAYSFHRDIKYVCKSLDYFKVPDIQVGSKSEMNNFENQLQCQINQYNTKQRESIIIDNIKYIKKKLREELQTTSMSLEIQRIACIARQDEEQARFETQQKNNTLTFQKFQNQQNKHFLKFNDEKIIQEIEPQFLILSPRNLKHKQVSRESISTQQYSPETLNKKEDEFIQDEDLNDTLIIETNSNKDSQMDEVKPLSQDSQYFDCYTHQNSNINEQTCRGVTLFKSSQFSFKCQQYFGMNGKEIRNQFIESMKQIAYATIIYAGIEFFKYQVLQHQQQSQAEITNDEANHQWIEKSLMTQGSKNILPLLMEAYSQKCAHFNQNSSNGFDLGGGQMFYFSLIMAFNGQKILSKFKQLFNQMLRCRQNRN